MKRTPEQIAEEQTRNPLLEPREHDLFAMVADSNDGNPRRHRIEITDYNPKTQYITYTMQRADESFGPILGEIKQAHWQMMVERSGIWLMAKRVWQYDQIELEVCRQYGEEPQEGAYATPEWSAEQVAA